MRLTFLFLFCGLKGGLVLQCGLSVLVSRAYEAVPTQLSIFTLAGFECVCFCNIKQFLPFYANKAAQFRTLRFSGSLVKKAMPLWVHQLRYIWRLTYDAHRKCRFLVSLCGFHPHICSLRGQTVPRHIIWAAEFIQWDKRQNGDATVTPVISALTPLDRFRFPNERDIWCNQLQKAQPLQLQLLLQERHPGRSGSPAFIHTTCTQGHPW